MIKPNHADHNILLSLQHLANICTAINHLASIPTPGQQPERYDRKVRRCLGVPSVPQSVGVLVAKWPGLTNKEPIVWKFYLTKLKNAVRPSDTLTCIYIWCPLQANAKRYLDTMKLQNIKVFRTLGCAIFETLCGVEVSFPLHQQAAQV